MRVKDENKKEAIFKATISLLNEIGFSNISMSKIAKVAGVSSSTIYTYFDNKEDMLKKVYMEAKKQMVKSMSVGIAENGPVRESINKLCHNILNFLKQHNEYLLFLEQSSTSPLIIAMSHDEIHKLFIPLFKIFEKGVKEGVLKQLPTTLLMGFCYYPIVQIRKEEITHHAFKDIDYEQVFQMCWDAIKA
jgi:AcrR family transcriptional regulator